MGAVDHEHDRQEVGRQLGHDLFRFRRHPDVASLHAVVGEGFAHAAQRGLAQEMPDRYTRKWLQLRANAFRRERIVDADVTPQYLAQIDVAICPVLRVPLTHGSRTDSDWSVDRLNNEGAYAPSNLAVISTAANRAKSDRPFAEVLGLARGSRSADGLQPAEWLRMATIMLGPCHVERPRDAPTLPLVAPLPARTVRSATQLIQHVFTQQAATLPGVNLLIRRFKAVTTKPHALDHLRQFAEGLHRALHGLDVSWDVWLRAETMQGLQAWRSSLTPAQWALAGEIAAMLASAGRVDPTRLSRWHLLNGGYADGVAFSARRSRP